MDSVNTTQVVYSNSGLSLEVLAALQCYTSLGAQCTMASN